MLRLPLDKPDPVHPPVNLRAVQAKGAVHRVRTAVGDPAWLITGYRQVHELFNDPRLGRSHPDPANAARSGKSLLFGGPMGNYATEQEDHARLRERLRPHFSPRRMRELQPRVAELTARLLDDIEAGPEPADLVAALALPLPIGVICELLGVPYQDRDQFRLWSQAAADTADRERSEQGLLSLWSYGQDLVRRKRTEPAADVISRLCADPDLSDEQIAALSMGLLFAGHETTVTAIGTGLLLLLTHTAQWRALCADPAGIAAAVEEILRGPGRAVTPVVRYAHADIVVDGVAIAAGELVLLDHSAANHDRALFPDADRFDITRAAAAHLSFGHGAHYCIGAPLARMELQTVFAQLTARFPALRLAVPASRLTLTEGGLLPALTALPVLR